MEPAVGAGRSSKPGLCSTPFRVNGFKRAATSARGLSRPYDSLTLDPRPVPG
jgi:hypothetical protein